MKKLTAYFFRGLIFLIPIVVTLYILYVVFLRIDQIFSFNIPGIGFLFTLALVTTIGFLVSTFFVRGAASIIDDLFNRLPVVKMVYSSVKDLMNAFVGDKKQFDKPVMVHVAPGSGITIMGFITRESLATIGLAESIAVYVPQSFNFAGNVLVVPKDQITPLNMESGKVMAFIVSGGASGL